MTSLLLTGPPDLECIMPDYRKTPEALARLSPLQYRVTQEAATEWPFDNEFNEHQKPGLYLDIV
jgi:peptide-methionine (R)-S-oxide reductase